VIEPGETDPDEIALVAIDAGAIDVVSDDDQVEVFTESQDLHRVQEALSEAELNITSADLIMRPKTVMATEPDMAVKTIRLMERLEDLDDVQQIFTNLDVTDEVLAQVS
jgi:transcriptional/translational regulatory protein YebC/TACO1